MKRNPWMRIAATVSAMLAVLLLATSWRYFVSRGVFASVEERTPGLCRAMPGIGPVAAIAPGTAGSAYVASAAGLYLYRANAVEQIRGTPKDFHPVALTAYGNTLHVLFGQDGHWTISVFSVKPAVPEVEELGRLSTDVLTDPADLVSVDDVRFYLVNRHGTHTAVGRWLDDAFLLPRANVLFFDGMKFVTVAERLNSPEGLTLSNDLSRLTVAEDYPRTLANFTRNEFVGSLDNANVLSLPAGPRKITLGPNGALIVAAKPKAGAGQVYVVTTANGVPQKAELIYSSKSEEVTAAAQIGRHLLVGTKTKLLDCTR